MEIGSQSIERFYYVIVRNNHDSIILDYSRPILLFFKSKNRKLGLKGKPLGEFFLIQPNGKHEIAEIPADKASLKFNYKTNRFILNRYPLTMDPRENVDIVFLTPYTLIFEKHEQFPEVVSLQLFEQTLLSSLGDGIYIRNFKGEIVFVNQRFCDLHGVKPNEIIGTLSTSLLVQDSLKKSGLIDLNYLSGETAAHTYIGKVNRKDRKEVWVEVTNSLLTFQTIPFAIAGIVRDVSKREDIIRELREAYLINENISAFVSHEIQGALAAIHSYTEYLILKPDFFGNSTKVMNYLEVILSNAKRIKSITKDILTSFSLTYGPPVLNIDSVNSAELITQCAAELSGLIEAKNIRIKVKAIGYQSPIILVDHGKFSRVILNLLENAIKYSTEFSAVTVSIETIEERSMAKISIIDEGIGIQKDDLEVIFTQFHRGRNVGKIKGTGLGLYISKKFIDLMKGELFIHSEGLGKGTQVIIYVPLSTSIGPQAITDSKILI